MNSIFLGGSMTLYLNLCIDFPHFSGTALDILEVFEPWLPPGQGKNAYKKITFPNCRWIDRSSKVFVEEEGIHFGDGPTNR